MMVHEAASRCAARGARSRLRRRHRLAQVRQGVCSIDGGRVSFTVETATPARPLPRTMLASRRARRSAASRRRRAVDVDDDGARCGRSIGSDITKQPVPGVKNVIAVGAGKGRRRQDHRVGEPGDRAQPGRRARRDDRRRHLRSERADHARDQDAARHRRQADRPGGAVRHPARLDGVPDAATTRR